MTEEQAELIEKCVESAMDDTKGLTSWEIDFLENMDNLSDKIELSDAQDSSLNIIANKLGVR